MFVDLYNCTISSNDIIDERVSKISLCNEVNSESNVYCANTRAFQSNVMSENKTIFVLFFLARKKY